MGRRKPTNHRVDHQQLQLGSSEDWRTLQVQMADRGLLGNIKQLLQIKTFVGTTKNAVMIQIWTALITILLLKVMKARAKYGWHLSNLVAFIRLNIFVKIDLQKWLDKPFEVHDDYPEITAQGVLFPNSS